MTHNWRTEIDASDFFGAQKKRVELEERRPAPSTASDLVGPGIGAAATPVDNFDDLLVTYNGVYSWTWSGIGSGAAAGAPAEFEDFIIEVYQDSVHGGLQRATGSSGGVWVRRFDRGAMDPASITRTAWVEREEVPRSACRGTSSSGVSVPVGTTPTYLSAPTLLNRGYALRYAFSRDTGAQPGVNILKEGHYTGNLLIRSSTLVEGCTIVVTTPWDSSTDSTTHGPFDLRANSTDGVIPISFFSTVSPGTPTATNRVTVTVRHTASAARTVTWADLSLLRIGSAI